MTIKGKLRFFAVKIQNVISNIANTTKAQKDIISKIIKILVPLNASLIQLMFVKHKGSAAKNGNSI